MLYTEEVISVNGISKQFLPSFEKDRFSALFSKLFIKKYVLETERVLKDVSFNVDKGDCLAFMGHNGAGKTTLLKIIANIVAPTSGTCSINGALQALFNFQLIYHNRTSLLVNLYLLSSFFYIPKDNMKDVIEIVLDESGLYNKRDECFKNLSLGQKQRVILCLFSYSPADIFIFDDSFRFVDKDFLEFFKGRLLELRKKEKTILVASHDDQLLLDICTKGLVIEDGTMKKYSCYKSALEYYHCLHQMKKSLEVT